MVARRDPAMNRALIGRDWAAPLIPVVAAATLAACGGGTDAGYAAVQVVTTVSPLRNIVENVGGDRVEVVGLVPEGANAHTFEPPPSAVRAVARADLIVINGLGLEPLVRGMVDASKQDEAELLLVGERAITADDYVYDRSFPRADGRPNPHLWTAPNLAIEYAAIVRDALSRVDPAAAGYYAANFERFEERVLALDAAIFAAVATIPEPQRRLLTYHDSFPYFAPRYGLEIIGAIQPSDFSEPSPREVARLIEQIRREQVPAIFGSEVFASDVLDRIAAEAGAVQVSTLRDDDLPGEPGDPDNTYLAMMVENVRTMTAALGGDAAALDGFDVRDTWVRFDAFQQN